MHLVDWHLLFRFPLHFYSHCFDGVTSGVFSLLSSIHANWAALLACLDERLLVSSYLERDLERVNSIEQQPHDRLQKSRFLTNVLEETFNLT